MATISVAIITLNEADNIRDCIKSVQWCNDIVVVDQFSSDGTAEIARQLGARVFQEPWKGYAQQKNSAIEKTTGPWILSLDADERVTPALRDELEQVIAHPGDCKGYYINRKNYFCGRWIRHGGWHPDFNLRLFQKNSGKFEERSVHEKIIVDGPVGHLKESLDHYSYRSVTDFLIKLERYSRLAAVEISGMKPWAKWPTLILRPIYTFFSMYLLRGGILDGTAGFFLAVSYGYYTFLKYYRYYEHE